MVCTSCLFGKFVCGQNLVPNPGFEEFDSCPDNWSELSADFRIPYWVSPTDGSPDYFNVCSKKCGVPWNYAGYSYPRSGSAYVGVITRMAFDNDRAIPNREYVQAKLISPLESGKNYLVSVFVKPATQCLYGTDAFGIVFTHDPIRAISRSNLPLVPWVKNEPGNILKNKKEWFQISSVYTAKGFEKYINIGNFENNENTQWGNFNPAKISGEPIEFAYYYIDDVQVSEILPAKNTPLALELDEIKTGKPFVLKNVSFETGSAKLLPASFPQLDSLIAIMKLDSTLYYEISGHTDSVGTWENNQKLSFNRARSVSFYLEQRGVDYRRLRSAGYANTRPLASNETAEGRALNRRVEIKCVVKE